jgi:YesN/AraC family two-component response regulator
MTPEIPCQILVVDDDKEFREVLCGFLDSRNHQTYQAASGEDALKLMQQLTPDVIFLDICMPGMNGLELSKIVRSLHPDARIVAMSGYSAQETAKEAIGLGAADFLMKPIELEDLEYLLPLIQPQKVEESIE